MSRAQRAAAVSGADAATAVMIGALGGLGSVRNALVVGEASGRLAAALRVAGAEATPWLREAVPAAGSPAASAVEPRPWPPPGPFDAALIRLPKAKAALDLALHAAASVVAPGGRIAVFGANHEGAKSAAARLGAVATDVATLCSQRHARVVAGRRPAVIAGLRARLADWRTTGSIELPGRRVPWVSYPGVFAGGGLDAGTRLLLAHLPALAPGMRILDFAAGSGVIGGAASAREPAIDLTLLDCDVLALEAAGENVPRARRIAAADLAAAGGTRFHLILSNPPLHQGVAESHVVLQRLIADAPDHLAPGGRLVLVVQRRVPVQAALEAAFGKGSVEVLADDGRYRVVGATRRKAPAGRA